MSRLVYLILKETDLSERHPVRDAYIIERGALIRGETRARTMVPEQIVEWETEQTPQRRETYSPKTDRFFPLDPEKPAKRKITLE
jgi:hypothetical protein